MAGRMVAGSVLRWAGLMVAKMAAERDLSMVVGTVALWAVKWAVRWAGRKVGKMAGRMVAGSVELWAAPKVATMAGLLGV